MTQQRQPAWGRLQQRSPLRCHLAAEGPPLGGSNDVPADGAGEALAGEHITGVVHLAVGAGIAALQPQREQALTALGQQISQQQASGGIPSGMPTGEGKAGLKRQTGLEILVTHERPGPLEAILQHIFDPVHFLEKERQALSQGRGRLGQVRADGGVKHADIPVEEAPGMLDRLGVSGALIPAQDGQILGLLGTAGSGGLADNGAVSLGVERQTRGGVGPQR